MSRGQARFGSQGNRSVADCWTSPELLAEFKDHHQAGTLEQHLMARTFGNPALRYAIKGAADKRKAQEGADKAVAERAASGGRKASYAPSLSYDCPIGATNPHFCSAFGCSHPVCRDKGKPDPHADSQHWYEVDSA